MMGFLFVIHTIVCILLTTIILMQSGRGGGLTEGFASAENMFGARTSAVLVKSTTVLASLFLILCLSLAVLSSKKNQSLMAGKNRKPPVGTPVESKKPEAVTPSVTEGVIQNEEQAPALKGAVETPSAAAPALEEMSAPLESAPAAVEAVTSPEEPAREETAPAAQ